MSIAFLWIQIASLACTYKMFVSGFQVLQKLPHIFGERVSHSTFKHAYATGRFLDINVLS